VTPAVSVIIPCYDAGAFLLDAIDSALASTVDDLEVVVVDDGSTDPATQALLDRLDRPRTTVLRGPNGGSAAARNTGLAHARGRWVLPLDADDLVSPTLVEKALAILEAEPALGWVYTHVRFFGEAEFVCRMAPYNFYVLLWENLCCATALVRRSAMEAVGGYTAALRGYEDWDLWLKLGERGWHGRLLPEVLFHYRRHGETQGTRSIRRHRELVALIRANHPRLYDPRTLRAVRREWCAHPVATDALLSLQAAVRAPWFPRPLRAVLAGLRDATPFARKVAPGGA